MKELITEANYQEFRKRYEQGRPFALISAFQGGLDTSQNKQNNITSKKIQNLKSWTAIQKFNPKIANILKSVFDEMELGKRKYEREYNEILVSRPKIQAFF